MNVITLKLQQVCIEGKKGKYICRSTPLNMSNQRMHWAVKSKWTRAWKEEVMAAWFIQRPKSYPKKTPKLKGVKIVIQLHKIVLMDYDGAYHSVKPVLDGMIEAGIIYDDSPKYIDLKVKQIKVAHRAEEKTLIKIL